MGKIITKRCSSPYCIEVDGLKGRPFEVDEDTRDLSGMWCTNCIKLGNEIRLFSGLTIDMIRATYTEYADTNLPREVKLFMEQYTRELIGKLGGEL